MTWEGLAVWVVHKDGKLRPGVVLAVLRDGRLYVAVGRGRAHEDPNAQLVVELDDADGLSELLGLEKTTHFWHGEVSFSHATDERLLLKQRCPIWFVQALRVLHGFKP